MTNHAITQSRRRNYFATNTQPFADLYPVITLNTEAIFMGERDNKS